MLCLMCGQPIKSKSIEGADYIKADSKTYCIRCARQCLTKWPEFERHEQLAENGSKYREALIDTLRWSINDGYCMKPKERCEASPDKCLGCWLEYLVGEKEE